MMRCTAKVPPDFFAWSISKRKKYVVAYNKGLPALNQCMRETNARREQKREDDWAKYRATPTPKKYQWLNMDTNPCKAMTGFDAGRTAWKFHAVECSEKTTFSELGSARAICGMRPRYGWTIDLLMDVNDAVSSKCMPCLKQIAKGAAE